MKSLSAYMLLIERYFKKEKAELLVELALENYNNRNLYFRIDYYRKDLIYKLSFIDLDHIENNNLRVWINTCNIEPNSIEHIENLINNLDLPVINQEIDKYRVTLNTFFKKFNHITFKRYLPMDLYMLIDVFLVIFNNAPKKLEGYFFEMMALICNDTQKYEYRDTIKFNIYKGNIDKLFSPQIIYRGNKYYEDGAIKFLEKIGNKFYAIVEGADEYVVIIDYDEKSKMMKLYCSCPCEFYCKHLYAVLKAIQNKEEKRFYKLILTNEKDTNYINRLLETNVFLCTGIDRSSIKIINKEAKLELVPILDINGKNNFEIIEDDDEKSLSKKFDIITHKKRK